MTRHNERLFAELEGKIAQVDKQQQEIEALKDENERLRIAMSLGQYRSSRTFIR